MICIRVLGGNEEEKDKFIVNPPLVWSDNGSGNEYRSSICIIGSGKCEGGSGGLVEGMVSRREVQYFSSRLSAVKRWLLVAMLGGRVVSVGKGWKSNPV